MHLPFETHKIYITLDDEKEYQLFSDFTKKEVNFKEILTLDKVNCKNPVFVLHKKQFDYGKETFLNEKNPSVEKMDAVKTYNLMGFISDEEMEIFFNKAQ